MEFFNAVISTFTRGGLVMWPIAIFSLYGFILIIERWQSYKQQESSLLSVITSMTSMEGEKIISDGYHGNASIRNIVQVVAATENSQNSEQVEKVRNVFRQEQAFVEKRLNTISVIATLLPMLGLLGTVVGMISAFDAIALHGTGNPNLMAEGISQALITTEVGLLASIPMFYLHNEIAEKADKIVRQLDEFTTHLLHKKEVRD